MRRNRGHGLILGVVLAANFAGLTFQFRTGFDLPVRDALSAVFGGGQSLASSAAGAVVSWVETLGRAGALQEERDQLAERVARLEWEVTVQRGMLQRADGFTSLDAEALDLGEPLAAEIVGVSASPLDRTVIVNRGRRHGVARNAPVMAARGLVGRVVTAGPANSQVELLTSPTAAAAVITSASRSRGVVRSAAEEEADALRMHFVPVGQRVDVGEDVISSGLDALYPKGLLVGRVSRVLEGDGLLLDIFIEPAVDFDVLERVFVLPPQSPRDIAGEAFGGSEAGANGHGKGTGGDP